MRDPAIIEMLPDGRRLYLHDGPIDLIVEASGTLHAVSLAYEAAGRRFTTILDELCAELPALRSHAGKDSARLSGAIARRMANAVAPYRARWFITPMAAVAGAVAEAVLEAMTDAGELDRAYVNNGGDIAVHLGESARYTIGMVERPDRPSLFGSVEINSSLPVRGIATSGWRGRSFSLGIADAVTVLAADAAAADAAATIIANAVDLPGHGAIVRVRARDILPDSDLGEMLVTRGVGELTEREIEKALNAGMQVAEEVMESGLIFAAALSLRARTRLASRSPIWRQMELWQRSLLHA
jgi:uncharacterized protein